jgi:glutamate synthase (NADPH/NADH) small chain
MLGSISPRRNCSKDFDAIVLSGGAERTRSPVPGRDLSGVHFAIGIFAQQNRRIAKNRSPTRDPCLGLACRRDSGGDTGSDCIGTVIPPGALSMTQLEILPRVLG